MKKGCGNATLGPASVDSVGATQLSGKLLNSLVLRLLGFLGLRGVEDEDGQRESEDDQTEGCVRGIMGWVSFFNHRSLLSFLTQIRFPREARHLHLPKHG